MTAAGAPDRHLAQQRVKRLASAFVRPVIAVYPSLLAAPIQQLLD